MIRTYFNERAAIWDNTAAEKDISRLENMAEKLTIPAGSTVLDVGSGTGIFLPYIVQKLGKQGTLIALDIAEQMLRISTSKKHDGNIAYIQGDITSAPLKHSSVDCVICYSSFPHFHDKPRAFKEIARLLKESGTLYICHTSSREHINSIHENIPQLNRDVIPESAVMMEMLTESGFKDIGIEEEKYYYFVNAIKQG
jgi:ubiquinone/menaquinone biosynthesis C-methylase UbiE